MKVAIDFETDGIETRPSYPPEPRGVAIMVDGKPGKYVSGSRAKLEKALLPYWLNPKAELIFHNASFDLAVATEKLGLPMPDWRRVHDTLFLAFLEDPHAKKLGLKESAERYLGMPPTEQQDVKAWVMEHVPAARRSKVNWGYWIAQAPPELLAPYAIGDVDRTLKLFTRLHQTTQVESYNRERRILGGLLENSATGIRCDRNRLARDLTIYEQALLDTDTRLYRLLGGSFNVDSGDELAARLLSSGKGKNFKLTPTGKISTAKDSLLEAVSCHKTLDLLNYRGRLVTALQTFMRPWLQTASCSQYRVFFEWYQTRGTDKNGSRTGRLSSSPNVQNIPKKMRADAPKGLPQLPLLRTYLLPEKGHVWMRKDYSQQELRMLAHFEDSELLAMYQADTKLDLHQKVADMFEEAGRPVGREVTKTLSFGLLYGMGLAELSKRLNLPPEETKSVKAQYLKLLPGINMVNQKLKVLAKTHKPFTTWGGRKYFCEPPMMIKGQLRTFEYKMINYLIQGSSADVTKEALALLFEAKPPGRFLCTVHDEINWSVPVLELKRAEKMIHDIMRSVKTDVVMESTTETGPNWGTLKAYG